MADETITTESAPVETPPQDTEISAEVEAEEPGQEEEKPPDSDTPESEETETEAEPVKAKNKPDSETRATETAKRQAIELRSLKREMRQLRQSIQAPNQRQEIPLPAKPKLEDFLAEDDPQAALTKALEKFEKDTRDYAVFNDRREQAAIAQREAQKKQTEEFKEVWNKREKDTLKRIPEYNLHDAYEEVEPTETMIGFIENSDIGPDVLWHLKENPDVAENLRSLSLKNPWKAARELIKLEDSLNGRIKGIKPKSPATKPPAKIKGDSAGPARGKNAADLLYGP